MTGNNKAIVLSDMLSDSIEYKNRRSAQLICDPKSIPIFSIISLHRDPKYIQICFLHIYNPQIEMFARFKMKSSFHKTKRII